jgi:ribonuclease HII
MTYNYIIGADGVGEGSIAGPAVYCGVIAKNDWTHAGIDDSKKLTSARRAVLVRELMQLDTIEHIIVVKSNVEIDTVGLAAAMRAAYGEIASFFLPDDVLDAMMIIDGQVKLSVANERIKSVPKADGIYPTVMAASILAKEHHDHLMKTYAKDYPGYDFENSVGYGSKKHKDGIRKFGMCDLHRKSYKIKLSITT